ncbi:facilitated trehalose transporter Tret1-like [Anopheles moucheti]|uniref:facilitated trehalose transporter Tret1-like n=1 Tax=Anopheles moucheti TaxID=186751 RepID=UPI0022F0ED09|nr:facilitated trehalose transporter Tret1-like [Anopheles moucheti]XP_052899206.1 facilitated trehalose transporter Tret1-like [Anopheles moucheti]
MVIKKAPTTDDAFIESNVVKHFSPLARQVLAASGPIISSAAAGMTNGFSAILLPQLQHPDSKLSITEDQASWIASMAPLPMALGCILGGLLMERCGRKSAHLLLNISFAVGWCALSMAGSYPQILAGRFITGLSCGLVGPPASVYIAETSDPRYRGILLAGVTFAVSGGILLAHLFGTFFRWQTAALLCSLFMIVAYLLMLVSPESPAWLLARGARSEAETSFRWLRGFDPASRQEFDAMVARTEKSESNDKSIETQREASNVNRSPYRRREFLMPLATLLVFFATMQFSGVNIVAFYSIALMKTTIGSDNLNEYLAMLIVDLVRVVTSLVACILLRSVGRRPLAMASGVGTTVSLIGLSIFLYFQTSIPLYRNYSWLSLVFLISYIVFVGIGLFPLPWCMTGEIFPVATRGLGSGLTSSFNFVCFFAVIKTGPTLFATVGINGTFLVYGVISLLGTLLLYVILPETKNRTLQEIEEQFRRGRRKAKDAEAATVEGGSSTTPPAGIATIS